MENLIIVYGGAFNPPTPAHAAAIRALSRRAGDEGRLMLLPSGAKHIGEWKPGERVLPDTARIEMLERIIDSEQLNNTVIDTLSLRENLCTFDALERLRTRENGARIVFAMGEDKLTQLPKWVRAGDLVKSTDFIVVQYDKQGSQTLALEGLDNPVRMEYVKLPVGTKGIHASEIRARMRRHDPALAEEGYLPRFPECVRLAACAPRVYPGDPFQNAKEIIRAMANADADILAFPELTISGYTCADMLASPAFLRACEAAAVSVIGSTRETGQLVCFGSPVVCAGRLFDCALAAQGGRLLAVIPKTYLANDHEFYERRWFASALDCDAREVDFAGTRAPFGTDILIRARGCDAVVAAEICEDAWTPIPPSMRHCMAGANVILNLSASNDLISKNEYRRDMLASLSAKGRCAYVYASSGAGESSSDAVYGGRKFVVMNGGILAENDQPVSGAGDGIAAATVDLSTVQADRLNAKSFIDARYTAGYRIIECELYAYRFPPVARKLPFVPTEQGAARAKRCLDILDLQSKALAQRITGAGIRRVVIGVSGGLDSTLALLVAHNTFQAMGMPARDIITVTMPGAATGERTRTNAADLCCQLGTDFRTVEIADACALHEKDIGHDPEKHDVTYENIQARERTQILMDIANMENAIVVGTGDLSELALGWCTYNGDHMSHYCVNCGVPKTLVQFMVRTYAENLASPKTRATLVSILETEITPELVPGGASTEERIGKYLLHDFFLFYFMRYGYPRGKLRYLAAEAFGADCLSEIDATLDVFFSRFFANQFKRNCLPDGPKIGSVSLSPRADLRLPADAAKNWFTQSAK